MTATDYTTLINELTADGWTTPDGVPPRRSTLPAHTPLSPTGHLRLRLRLITTGASTLALLEPACAPHCETAEHAWQVRAEDPDPAVYLAAARAACPRIVADLDGHGQAAALRTHGWHTLSARSAGRLADFGFTSADGYRSIAHFPDDDPASLWEIALPGTTAHALPITATAHTPSRVLLALALAPLTSEPHPPSPASTTATERPTTRPAPTGRARSSSNTRTATTGSMVTATSTSTTDSLPIRHCATCHR